MRNMNRNTDVSLVPAEAGSETRWNSPPKGGVQCFAHAPDVSVFCEQDWLDPDQPYTGPVDTDLSTHPDAFTALTAIFNFATEAQTETIDEMRRRWPRYRRLVPDDLARVLVREVG